MHITLHFVASYTISMSVTFSLHCYKLVNIFNKKTQLPYLKIHFFFSFFAENDNPFIS